MNCPICNSQMIHSNDFDYEDLSISGDGIIQIYNCTNNKCNVEVDVYIPLKSN